MQETRLRRATSADLEAIVDLLADDPLGSGRESAKRPLAGGYSDAFDAIDRDPNQELAVLQVGDRVAGVLQITYVPSLTYVGRWRAQIEGVRVASSVRGEGLGERMFRWAVERARSRGCRIVQLTTDKSRPDALRFYEALGFRATHEGMKLHLEGDDE